MIRVVAAEVIPVTFRLREGYRIAGASFHDAFNAVLKIDTSDGRTGFGCASPAEEVTGETGERCLAALRDVLLPLLRESDAGDLEGLGTRAAAASPDCPAARAAVDIALHDLLGQRAGQPLARLLGMRRERLPTSITLGIEDDPAATLERARRHVREGFRYLKIKIGENWEVDAALVRALKDAVGAEIALRADGNQGYSESQARRFLGELRPGDLELLEQPIPAAGIEAMSRLARDFDVPIMADEALCSEDDARSIVNSGAADLVNIKLMKSGGVGPALRIATIAAGGGVVSMAGCNDESRIGISAALHCALAADGMEKADLDGHLDLADDVAAGGIRIVDGYVLPFMEKPGLGISVDL